MPNAKITRRRWVQSRAMAIEVWEFIHLATCLAVGIPGHAYVNYARMVIKA